MAFRVPVGDGRDLLPERQVLALGNYVVSNLANTKIPSHEKMVRIVDHIDTNHQGEIVSNVNLPSESGTLYPERPGGLFRGSFGDAGCFEGRASMTENRVRRATANSVKREGREPAMSEEEGVLGKSVDGIIEGSS